MRAAAQNRLFAFNYRDDLPVQRIDEEHSSWGRKFMENFPLYERVCANVTNILQGKNGVAELYTSHVAQYWNNVRAGRWPSNEADLQAILKVIRRHGYPRKDLKPGIGNYASKDRRLRIGYVSGDWFTHSVSYFSEAPLRYHNRDEFEACSFVERSVSLSYKVQVFCYVNNSRVDDRTHLLQSLADQ